MHIQKIQLTNFRCYANALFEFQPGFNLIIGVNGSGKTSLLNAVALSFSDLSYSILKGTLTLSERDAMFVVEHFDERVRFERKYPVQINASGDYFGEKHWCIIKERAIDNTARSQNSLFAGIKDFLTRVDEGQTVSLPLIAYYRANRRWATAHISAERAATQQASRLDAYSNWQDAAVDLQEFESWLIGKTLERLQRVSRQRSPIAEFDDELQLVNEALKIALPDSVGIEYDLDLRSIMVKLSTERSLPFTDLSDGQRSLVATIADIARRMCLLNPHLGNEVLKKTTGTVMIDELDIHLHPAWQRTIALALKTAFPSIQFIAASHSPQVIGSLLPDEVILLNSEGSAHPRVTYGLDSSSVLEEVMGTTPRDPEVDRMLRELFATLENNDIEGAKDQLAGLKERVEDLPEFYRAEALLKRKEMIGR